MFKRLITSQTLRRRTSWMIAAVLILPFIIFFHATGRAPVRGPGGIAGTVFGREVPWETFEEQRFWLRRQWENRFGEIPQQLEPLLAQQAWDRILLIQEAKRQHLRVDDRQLADFIHRIPAFQDNSRFQLERYHRFLSAANISPRTFEEQLRDDLLIEQLVNRLKATVSVTEDDVRQAYEHAHERLTASVWVFDPASFRQAAERTVTEETLRAWYDAHPEQVRIPEQIRFDYAGASLSELSPKVALSPEELKAYYDEHAEEFKSEDGGVTPFEKVQETVRQRLTQERVRKQLTALALDLQEDVEAKLRFEEIVASRALLVHSAGPMPADGFVGPQAPEPAVLKEVATLGEGQMSGVIATDRGVYVARVTQRIPPRVPPFEEVHATIRQRRVQEQAVEASHAAATDLSTRLQERLGAGLTVDEALVAVKAPAARSLSFSRTGPIDPIGSAPEVNETAFETPLGQLTDVLQTPRGFVILRPQERTAADASKFTEEQAALRQETLTRKQAEAIEGWLGALRVRAKLRSYVDATTG